MSDSYDSDSDDSFDDLNGRSQVSDVCQSPPPPSTSGVMHQTSVMCSNKQARMYHGTNPAYALPLQDMGAVGFTKEDKGLTFQNDPYLMSTSQASKDFTHKGQNRDGANNSSVITLQRLENWANEDNFTILAFSVSTDMESLRDILQETQVPVQYTYLLLMIFKKITLAHSQLATINFVITTVINSSFLESQMRYFFHQLPQHKGFYSQCFSIVQTFFDIFEYVLKNLPQYTSKCHSSLCAIQEVGKRINVLKENSRLTERFRLLMRRVEQNAPHYVMSQTTRQPRVREIPKPDEEEPPNDFSQLTIFPDLQELEASYEPFLRANKTSGPYRDVRHYTDVHFRLLREDYLSPIRKGIKDFKKSIQQNEPVKSKELRFYFGVRLVQMKTDNDGITFIVKFETKDLKNINWEFTNRFMYGALLCFSKDNFSTVIFATVASHAPKEHALGQVKVTFQSNLEDIFTSSEYDEYIMAETVSFFEQYRHVLEGLQEVKQIPLSDYILHCKKCIHPPSYIDDTTCFDFAPVMKRYVDRTVQLLSPTDWPVYDETILNDSQLDALKLALTKELAIIQGPPGTGKTYVGLKIMELLLRNRSQMHSSLGPILVVCYTNHALDQFLEGILEFCGKGIVRIGGRSQSEALKRFNLTELTKSQNISRHIKRSIEDELSFCRRQLKKICSQIRALWHESLQLETTVLKVDDLTDEISYTHFLSLTDDSRSDRTSNKMSVWMKAANADMEKHITEAAKRHLTTVIINKEGVVLDDSVLQIKSGMMRPDFETRVQIYRWWLQKVQGNLDQRLKIVLEMRANKQEKVGLTKEITTQKENAAKDILPDDIIIEHMTSPDVYECIKKCVELECGEKFQSSYVKCWLLGYFRSSDQILDAISRLMHVQTSSASQFKTRDDDDDNHDALHSHPRWVIEASDDSDDDSDMGFDIKDNEYDSSEDFNSETPDVTSEFKMLETDFNYSEKKDILLLQKAKLLNIDLNEDPEKSEEWQTVNTMTYSKVFHLIHTQEPFTEEYVSSIEDVWALSLPERYRLYKYWMLQKKSKIAHKIVYLTQKYNEILEIKKTALAKKKIAILNGAQVIGMTTTGAARHRKVIRRVAPKIIVVEEAAEVLEAHIITTLNAHCKHLILIGDHQQLRPNPTVHRLAVDYKFEISLFERLVKNNLHMVILEEQHRMRPEIANYLRLIYPNLNDHETVCRYNNVSGVDSNVYFIQHEFEERSILDSTSKENIHEAEFLIELCKYFFHHGYSSHQITILAAYSGQVTKLKEYKQMDESMENVRITSIDNYQGEENEIILLSLVRSNMIEEVGFLKTDNRVCVALSRARRGLFVIGNLKILAKHSKLWSKIADMATRTKTLVNSLKLRCINHNHHYSIIRTASDFKAKVPEGGCNAPCNAELDCGHKCPRLCHANDRDHREHICCQACLKTCSLGHRCQKECSEECGLCEVLVEKILPRCGHTDLIHCYEDEETACCHQPCGQKLACGHVCKGSCGECLTNACHSPCNEQIERQFPCLHVNFVPCHADVKLYPCPTKCKSVLNCKHRCRGTCGKCLNGRVHEVCSHRCEKFLPCGHQCSGKCGVQCEPCPKRCPLSCRHGPCSKITCGEPCDSCMENCALVCKHQQCHERCADKCIRAPCKRRCPLRTKCQHTCASYCGEECVCLICDYDNFKLLDFSKRNLGKPIPLASKERALKFKPDKDTILMKIPRCGHVFTVTQLDQYVKDFDPDGTKYIRCPLCKNTIHGIIRYDDQNKSRFLKRENRKYDVIQSFSISESELEQCTSSLELPEYQQKQLNCNRIKALKCCNIFSSVLKKIERMHDHFNWAIDFNKSKWKNVVLSIQTRVSAQFNEELYLEFHRLLILEQMMALKRMIDDAGQKLDKSLKTQIKMKKHFQEKLDANCKKEAEDLVESLYQEISVFKTESMIEKETKMLSTMSQDIKDTLDQAYMKE